MTTEETRDTLPRRIAAEAFGTYLLVFSVLGSALLFTPDNGGALPVALAIGISVFIGIVAVGAISGGHFNPAVTLGSTAPRTGGVGSAALSIGLALAMLHMVMIPVSNASLNPVRALAPALLADATALGQLWAVVLAPLVGGLLGGLLAGPLFGRQGRH